MRITVAKTAGFCPGVERAVEKVKKQAELGEPTYTLGELINNRQMVDYFAGLGIPPIQSPAENRDGRCVVIRSR